VFYFFVLHFGASVALLILDIESFKKCV